MLATFSFKKGRRRQMLTSIFLGLYSFSVFWPSWPPLGAIWARFGKVWGSILEGFWGRFWKRFDSILVASGDNFGLRLLLENLRLPLENLNLQFRLLLQNARAAPGWAGGITRSANNCYENIFISVFLTKSIILETAQPNTARALKKIVIFVRQKHYFGDRAAEYSARPQQ